MSWTLCASPRPSSPPTPPPCLSPRWATVSSTPSSACTSSIPVPSMKLVEIIRGANTAQETFDFVYKLSQEIGKEPCRGG